MPTKIKRPRAVQVIIDVTWDDSENKLFNCYFFLILYNKRMMTPSYRPILLVCTAMALLASCPSGVGQSAPAPKPASTISTAEYAASAQKAATELVGAIKTGDMKWVLDKMYPRYKTNVINKMAGGERALREKLVNMEKDFKQAGFKVESYDIGAPSPPLFLENDSVVLVTLPTRMVFSVQDGTHRTRAETVGFLYAIRHIETKNEQGVITRKATPWSFLDGKSVRTNELRDLFYDFPLDLKTPPITERILP